MFFLSPVKLIFVIAVAVIALGPDKLPAMARKAGGLWSDLHRLRERLETDVRGSFPDLPPTDDLVRLARSPLGYLGQLGRLEPPDDDVAGAEQPITFTLPDAGLPIGDRPAPRDVGPGTAHGPEPG